MKDETMRLSIIGLQMLMGISPAWSLGEIDFGEAFPLNTNAAVDTAYDGLPQIEWSGEGVWLTVWQSGLDPTDSTGEDWDIFFSRSTDDGITWSDPAAIHEDALANSVDDRAPRLARGGDGTYGVVWKRGDDIIFALSNDNGATWSDTIAVSASPSHKPDMAGDGLGNWVVVWASAADDEILASHSSDEGATWSDPAVLTVIPPDVEEVVFTDPRVETDGAGLFLIVWSCLKIYPPTGIQDGLPAVADLCVARSIDGGQSWSVLGGRVIEGLHQTSPALASDSLGSWLMIYTYQPLFPPGRHAPDSRGISTARSTDKGEFWNGAGDLFWEYWPGGSEGRRPPLYPQLTTDGTGSWVSVRNLGIPQMSTDDGETWESLGSLITGFDPQVSTNSQGLWISVWSDFDPDSPPGTDRDILVSIGRTSPPASLVSPTLWPSLQ